MGMTTGERWTNWTLVGFAMCGSLMNLCHPYQGWELGVCERGFSRVSLFFESPLGRFICVQIGVMYT